MSQSKPFLTAWRLALFATTACLLVGNLYYVQPLLGLLSVEFGRPITDMGYLTTFTQLGYALGILFLVPLGDVLNRRNLLTAVMAANVCALLVAAASPVYWLFGAASLVIGVTSCGIMVIVPYAASHAEDHNRGRAIGTIMTGVLLGVLLARTVSGFLGEYMGWRGTYVLAALVVLTLASAMRLAMPPEQRRGKLEYARLLLSLADVVRMHPVLRLRSFFVFLSFSSFIIMWTGLTFLLAGPPFHYPADKIGLFGLVGAAGALSANLAGRMADKGKAGLATTAFGVMLMLSWAGLAFAGRAPLAIAAGVFFLDIAVQGLQITNQVVIYRRNPEMRSRITSVYIFIMFVGAAGGSAAASASYDYGGWTGLCVLGGTLPAILVAVWLYARKRNWPGAQA